MNRAISQRTNRSLWLRVQAIGFALMLFTVSQAQWVWEGLEYVPEAELSFMELTREWFPIFTYACSDPPINYTHYGGWAFGGCDGTCVDPGSEGTPHTCVRYVKDNVLDWGNVNTRPKDTYDDLWDEYYINASIGANARSTLKLVWAGMGPPPPKVWVATCFELSATAVVGSHYGCPSANSSVYPESLVAITNGSGFEGGSNVARADSSIPYDFQRPFSRPAKFDVQFDTTSGKYFVKVPYDLILRSETRQEPQGSSYTCGSAFCNGTLWHTNDAIALHPRRYGEAGAEFDRRFDLFTDGDAIYLISGTELLDGAGALGCAIEFCGMLPATGQIRTPMPAPATDAAFGGYVSVSSPTPSGTINGKWFGIDQIQIVQTNPGDTSDRLLSDLWRGTGTELLWRVRGNETLAKQLLPKVRELLIYDADGTAIRFLGRKVGEQWVYEPAYGVYAELSGNEQAFTLHAGPPGSMHLKGNWVYQFAPLPPEGGSPPQAPKSYVQSITDPLGNQITLSGQSVRTLTDSVSGATVQTGSGNILYTPPPARSNHSQTLGSMQTGVSMNWLSNGNFPDSLYEPILVSWSGHDSMIVSGGGLNSPAIQFHYDWHPASTGENQLLAARYGNDPNPFNGRLSSRSVGNLISTTYSYEWLDRDRFQIEVLHGAGYHSKLIYTRDFESGKFLQMEYLRPALYNPNHAPGQKQKTTFLFNSVNDSPDNGQIREVQHFDNADNSMPTRIEKFDYEYGPNPLAVTKYTDPMGRLWWTSYMEIGRETVVTSTTDPTGVSVSVEYGSAEAPILPSAVVDGAGNRWEMTYLDPNEGYAGGLLASFKEPGHTNAWTFNYHPNGTAHQNKLMSVTDPTGRTAKITAYDLFGRPRRWEAAPKRNWNNQNELIWQETEWTLMGTPRVVSWSDGTSVRFKWQGPFLRMVTDSRGRTVWFNYDQTQPSPYPANLGNAGLLSQIKLGTDSFGNGGQVFANLYYDGHGRLASVSGGNQVGLDYSYGASGELIAVKHTGDFSTETFTYHCCGQIDTWRKQDLRSVQFDYDLNGQLTDILLSGSQDPSYQFIYDPAGRLLSLKDPTTPPNQPHTFTYDYTTGRLTQAENSLPIGTYTWNYQYLPSGEVSQATLTYPNQSSTVWNYEYDDAGRLTAIKRNNQLLATYDYDGAGRLEYQWLAPLSLTTTLQYADSQSVGAVGLLTHTRNGQTVASFDYRGDPNSPNRADWGYYADGTLHRASETFAGSSRQWEWDYHLDGSLAYEKLNGVPTDFTYDLGGNLTAWGEVSGWFYWYNQLTWIADRQWYYAYNANGERSRWWTNAGSQQLEGDVNRDGQVNDADLLLVMFMYGQSCNGCPEDLNNDGMVDDGDLLIVLFHYGTQNGYLSWEYHYDVWGNLVEAVSEAAGTYQAAYDGFGRRVWERVVRDIGETQTYFVYDGDTLVAELDASGNPIAEYSWGLLGPIARHDLQNPANIRYYIHDALGHTRALLDNQGSITDTYVYDAWGNRVSFTGTTPNPFTWNGASGYQWIEFTGLYHVGAREYDPRVGRWLQRDPIDVAGGDPNLYRYCLNDPLSFTDPTGTDLWEKLSNWYWGGMGGLSQLVDNILLGGATENLGRTVGEYECGNASGWEVVGSGVWLGFQLLPAARPVKAVSSGSKVLINQVGKTRGGVASVRLGQAGEKAAGIKGPKTSIGPGYKTKSGYRIPDEVIPKVSLTEVKNVKSLSYTQQLRDYMDYCKANNLKFVLVVRQNTQLSKTLLDLEKRGQMTIQRTLP